MSLIADALNKAQQQQQAARSAVAYPPRRFRPPPLPSQGVSPRALGWIVGIFAVVSLGAAGFAFRSHLWPAGESVAERSVSSTPDRKISSTPLPSPLPAPSPGSLAGLSSASSPFTAPSTVASAAPRATPTRDYELAGVTSLGKDTLLSISRRRDHRSLWIAVGKSAAEITVLSYQPETDHAVIRVDDNVLQIAMHDAFGDSPASSPTE